MNKKTAIVSVMLGILLIGIASAGLVGYLSNMVSGTVTVEGPVFYTAPGKILLINEEPATHGTFTIKDSEAIVFWTEENSGGIDFNYIPKLDLYIRAKVNSPQKQLELIFGYSDSSGQTHKICPPTLIDIPSASLDNYYISCEGSSTLQDVNKFYYKIQGEGDPSIEYDISTLNTRAEIVGVAQ